MSSENSGQEAEFNFDAPSAYSKSSQSQDEEVEEEHTVRALTKKLSKNKSVDDTSGAAPAKKKKSVKSPKQEQQDNSSSKQRPSKKKKNDAGAGDEQATKQPDKKRLKKRRGQSVPSFLDDEAGDDEDDETTRHEEEEDDDDISSEEYEDFDYRGKDKVVKQNKKKNDDDAIVDDKSAGDQLEELMSTGGTSEVCISQQNFIVPNAIKDQFESDISVPNVLTWLTLLQTAPSSKPFMSKEDKKNKSIAKEDHKFLSDTQKTLIKNIVTTNITVWSRIAITTVDDLRNAEKLIRAQITATNFASALVLHVGRSVTDIGNKTNHISIICINCKLFILCQINCFSLQKDLQSLI